MNVFEAVKQNVTTRQAAELYGIRVGRNGMAVCPFHNDKNPSMKLDRRFHCFGCQADGDAVDFVSRLFGLPSKEAAMKIADDFGISYDSRQKPSIRPKIREPTPEQKYQQEENHLQECEKCSNIFQKLKTECVVDTKENAESIQSSVMGKMAHSWKRSLLRSFIIGIVITTIVLTAIFGTYYALFIRQNSMVSPEQISISAYSLTDEQITFRLELLDGYCGGTIKTYTDENRNLYISVLRTVIKEELSDGETEIMNYGFNHEKKDYIAVYYGTPNNCELIWKKGDLLPTAPKDIFE